MTKKYFFLCFTLWHFLPSVTAQETITLSKAECESIFLNSNLPLIAEKLNIPIAKAAVQQAKLWPNPSFTLDQVNLWATKKQTGSQEVVPPLWGNFGQNQQFGMEIEQLIQTAGKRKKLVALEQVGVDKAEQYFRELLRNLKLELRKQVTALQLVQQNRKILQDQLVTIADLVTIHKKQLEQGNIAATEYTRLKAQELQVAKELNELEQTGIAVQKELKQLIHLNPRSKLVILDEKIISSPALFTSLNTDTLMGLALQNRPDYNLVQLEEKQQFRSLIYEKAQRTPDIRLSGAYDRNGNTMLNFIGFGASIDLPVFNKNQGNIKKATISLEQSKINTRQAVHNIQNETVLAYQQLQYALQLYQKIDTADESRLDDLFQAYTKNYKTRNISLLEYFDLTEAYINHKKTIIETRVAVNNALEELQYYIGTDLPLNNY